ncbi:hypothetical protein NUW58_g172 [Xylaria curta]|uniref:Uncharacterized protein n=1 Tax=Xylaria curta TaxID=42375 RepID=A0ACC1PQP5_9PEZI|nr:hypothetical protein NUW58_g172 [Xylaria curta]
MHVQATSYDPIAITGLSFKMPQDAVDETGLWRILENGENVKTRWPAARATTDTFYDDGSKKPNTVISSLVNHSVRHYAHFMMEDPGVFDAPFFSITAKEAASMSPRQRQALEVAYHAFESAGIPIEDLRGSLTAVYGASMADDWTLMASKDAESVSRMSITGTTPSLLPNKISWFFDLRGPSIHIDTACSSGLTALDLASKQPLICALVFGSSSLLSPEASLHLANLNFLSPDGCSYSFDARANGYGRGEGVVALYLKPLHQAVHDGDVVRAIIRATASNQDGRTPGLTQPSSEAQVELIRRTYSKAGLELSRTGYVEAHGTGTPTGDPIEAKALGRVFGKERSPEEPLFLGSIKANIGHLEGSSGPAGVVKAVMMLERGIIPPQALFGTLNPAIDAVANNIKVPGFANARLIRQIATEKTPWPGQGLRRISVNSFGFGGANAHVILDDALHYMRTHNMNGFYRCFKDPVSTQANLNASMGSLVNEIQCTTAVVTNSIVNGDHASISTPQLCIWSAADESAVHRMVQAYDQYYFTHIAGRRHKLAQLAYTLAARRSTMAWRTFAVVGSNDDTVSAGTTNESPASVLRPLRTAKPLRVNIEKTDIAFIFTGQGAQYAGMGLALLRYDIFAQSLRKSDKIFGSLGCDWSLFDAIYDQEKISTPEYSQPLCTALQIALVDLLRSFNLIPTAVVGHSSGEIAAAYTVAALSHESACRTAYFRGRFTGHLARQLGVDGTPGAMLSANLCEDEVPKYLESLGFDSARPADLIDVVRADLDKKGVFAQKLRTGVAYHSPAMRPIAEDYAASIGSLEGGSEPKSITMVSSVTGQVVEPDVLATPQYWVDNLLLPVQFTRALSRLTRLAEQTSSSVSGNQAKPFALTDLIEIGPHAALRRPIMETVPQLRYHSWIQRSASPLQSTLELVGRLFCLGYPISITAANCQDRGRHPYLVDCPAYPFDHSRRYWDESRISKDWRLRDASPGFLLGRRTHDWNPLKPRWRNWLCAETIPWVGEHNVTGTLVVPGTGSLVIAIEAARQTVARRNREISGFNLKDVQLLAPLRVGYTTQDAVETDVHLDQMKGADEKESTWFQFRIFSHNEGHVTETCNGQVQVQFKEEVSTPAGYERILEDERIRRRSREVRASCTRPLDVQTFYKRFLKYGFRYGPSFTVVTDTRFDPIGLAAASGKVNWEPTVHEQADDSPVHPAILDGVVQILLATAPKGLKGTSTMIPRRLGKVWVTNKVWSQITKAVHVASTFTGTVEQGGPFMNFWALADDDTPLCTIEDVQTAEISRAEKVEDSLVDRKLLHSIAWKPRLSSLTPGQLQKICETVSTRLHNFDLEVNARAKFFPKIESAMRSAAKGALQDMPTSQIKSLPAHYNRYINLLKRQSTYLHTKLQNPENHGNLSSPALEALLQECEVEYPQWFLFPVIARALPSIIRGDTDPLELMFANKAAETFYASVYSSHMLSGGFQTFINLASHENPRLRILEVGAGTGSFTRHILSTLEGLENEKDGTSFAEYVFTDISTAFFSNAQAQFKKHLDRMSFKSWNLEHDVGDENFGLDMGSYDIIIAGSVLHATSNLSKVLCHLRKLLKPGGYLVLQEITSTQSASVNIAFGALGGWWLSTEEWRQDGPLANQARWHQLLQDSGFQGIDVALKDFEDDAHHISTIMIARASEEEIVPIQNGPKSVRQAERQLVVVTDQHSVSQTSVVEGLSRQCKLMQVVDFCDIKAGWKTSPSDVVVSLVDVGRSRLAELSEEGFKSLQRLIQASRNLLWVAASTHDTAGSEESGSSLSWDPRSDIATGILRTVRSEESDKHIVTLIINQAHNFKPKDMADFVVEILHSSFNGDESRNSSEVEFVVQDGLITVGRMVHEKQLDKERESHLRTHQYIEQWATGPPLVLEVEKPGLLDSLRFVEDASYYDDLATDEVEIEAEAWPLSFRDIFIALGKINNGKELGWECAGKVTRVGSACLKHFKPGDRVVMGAFGSMRSRPRSKMQAVQKIPDNLSYIDAVSHVNPGMTAWHGLVNLARLQKGEKVLIHSAAGATGQMAVGIATTIGAEIFATVGSEEKKRLLVEQFNIPENHIFHSRDTSFAQGIARVTDGYGVDVILNSLAGESLQAGWECIAPFGRFIEIGKADIMANSSLPMGIFAKNITFAAVDLVSIVKTNMKLASELFIKTMGLIANGSLQGPKPLHLYPLAEVEKAFRFMQSGNSTGRIIITRTTHDLVTKHLVKRSNWRFDSAATYVIVGGLGGLGRVVIEWMVHKGARNLLVPSRSGVSSQAASDLVEKLKKECVHLATPKCDVSSVAEFTNALENYASSMPQAPIKGCINLAMALQDAIFGNMTHDQWTGTIRSKVQSSWNLHTLLPHDIDFFIMLSSLVGIYGAMGQSNYAAGCTFQDALARARADSSVYRGVSVSLDLGWVLDAGIVSEREDYRQKWEDAQDISGVRSADLVAVLDHFCDPARRSTSAPGLPNSSSTRSQLLIGAVTPADLAQHGEMIPTSLTPESQAQSSRARFRSATSFDKRCNVVIDALRDRLARALGVEMGDVDLGRPVSSYGVDSLMAVELRNWMRKDYDVEIPVFDILGGTTVKSLGQQVASKAEERKKEE